MNLKKGHLMSKSFSSVACGTQDVSHGESDSKEKGGRTCIATCKSKGYPDSIATCFETN